jgi:type I restriction enzyme M protein
VKGGAGDVDGGEFGVGDFDRFRIGVLVEAGVDLEPGACCGVADQVDDDYASHIHFGNSFTEDGEKHRAFDYMLANPPFGVEWKKGEDEIKTEGEKLRFGGRFGAGLPRINDGSFLFLQHMLSKMKPVEEGGSRLAIVFNGSPLFSGAAGSGESEIRRWIIENDWLEAVVALPDNLFYNTGISTYFWVLTNRKRRERLGKVQLLDARKFFKKMDKSLGEKRKEISPEQIDEITRLYGAFEENDKVKVFRNEEFGYQRVTVERPLRLRFEINDETAEMLASSNAYAKLAAADQERLKRGPDEPERPLDHQRERSSRRLRTGTREPQQGCGKGDPRCHHRT